MSTTTTTPAHSAGTRYVSGDSIEKLTPYVGQTLDVASPEWAAIGATVAGLPTAGRYTVHPHVTGENSKTPGKHILKLTPADDATTARAAVAAAEKRLAAIGTPEWVAAERVAAEKKLATAREKLAALTPAPVATPAATVATPAPAASGLAGILAGMTPAQIAGLTPEVMATLAALAGA